MSFQTPNQPAHTQPVQPQTVHAPQGWQPNPAGGYPAAPYGYGQPPQFQSPQKGKGFAVTALVLGILGCCFGLIPILGFVSFPLAVIGLVFGIIGVVGGLKGTRSGKVMAIVGSILCVLALVLAIVGVVIVNNAVNELGESLDEVSGGSTSQILEDNLDVQLGQFVTDGNEYIESGKMVVTLRNKGTETASFSVDIEAVDASGNRIEDDTAYVSDLAPGQSSNQDIFVLVPSDQYDALKGATFKVIEASMY